MEVIKANLKRVQEELENAGYPLFADLLSGYLSRFCDKGEWIVGVLGDDLVGKSTIINTMIGEERIPTSVIPSSADITLRYGEKEALFTSDGNVDKKDLVEIVEEENSVEIVIPNTILKDNNVVLKEFHGILNRQKQNDITLLSEVYKCDSVVLVLSAEHLLSESECRFIDNYVQYIGANHLLVVINKLSSVSKGDREHLLEYAEKQMSGRFPNVKWILYDESELTVIKKRVNQDIGKEVLLLLNANKDEKQAKEPLKNMLLYIKERLQKDADKLQKEQLEALEESKRKNEKLAELKKLETASIEEALIEFKQKRNIAIKQIDEFIQNQFERISLELLNEYTQSADKKNWYEKELQITWKRFVLEISKQTDKFTYQTILADVEWINGILQTKLGLDSVSLEMSARKMKKAEKLIPYGTYRRYAPIGAGGMAIIGYCLFNIVGAAIGLGSGLLAYSYLGAKEKMQDDEIKKEITSGIREISDEVRKTSRKDIEAVYDNILNEFEKEAMRIIDSKYKFTDINENNQNAERDKVLKIIKLMEEI